MKKFLTLILACSALPVCAAIMDVPEIGVMQGHDRQSIEDQYFRQHILSDVKEVKKQKEEFEKSTAPVQENPIVKQMINNTNSQFIEENGKIKIRYMY